MRQKALLLVTVSLLLAGCTTVTSESTPVDGSVTPSQAESSPTATADGAPVEYVVRAGEIPDEFGSVTVTLQVYFVEDTDDLGPCYPDVFSGPYEPTITPLPTPAGHCHSSEPLSVDLTEIDGEHSLGNVTAPSQASGHAVIATDVEATHRNGTSITATKGASGAELMRSENPPDGPYGVELGIGSAGHSLDYEYYLGSERFEPAGYPSPTSV